MRSFQKKTNTIFIFLLLVSLSNFSNLPNPLIDNVSAAAITLNINPSSTAGSPLGNSVGIDFSGGIIDGPVGTIYVRLGGSGGSLVCTGTGTFSWSCSGSPDWTTPSSGTGSQLFWAGCSGCTSATRTTYWEQVNPTIDNYPSNANVEYATTGTFTLSYWSATDTDPDTYIIEQDDNSGFTSPTTVQSGSWTSGSQKTYAHPKNLDLGNWYYRAIFTDDLSNSATSTTTIITQEDTTSPVLNNPTTPVYLEVSSSRTISWSWTDNYNHPSNDGEWRIYLSAICSGTIETSGTWTGLAGNYDFVASPTADTTYTMCVYDSSSNLDLDGVYVDITTAADPVLNNPTDLTLEDGSTRTISWSWTDNFNNPTNTGDFEIRSDTDYSSTCDVSNYPTLVFGGGLWSGTGGSKDQIVSPTVTTYYCIKVTDEGTNIGNDFLTATVTSSEAPVLNSPNDVTLEPDTSRTISWSWTDNFNNPTNTGDFEIRSDTDYSSTCDVSNYPTLENSGTWSGTVGSKDQIVSPTVTTYYCIRVLDEVNNLDTDFVTATVTLPQEEPSINTPSDLTMEDGLSTRSISWSWTDNFDNPTADYEVRSSTSTFGGSCTGGNIDISDTWSGTAGNYDHTSLSPSVTTFYCIKVTDEGLNIGEDFVTITVTTSAIPTLPSQSNQDLEVSSSRTISWSWTDNFDNPTDTGDYEIRSDTDFSGTCDASNYPTLENSGTWSSTAGSRNQIVSPTVTTYYCISVTDETQNSAYDFLVISVTSAQIPGLNTPTDYSIEDGATRTISWSWTDNFDNPTDTGDYEIRSDTDFSGTCDVSNYPTLVFSGTWSSTAGSRDQIETPSLTIYYCIKVTDEGQNSAYDFVTITVTISQNPQFTTTPNDFGYEFTNTTTLNIQWFFSDNVNGLSWNIKRSTDNSSWGSIIDSDTWSGVSGSSNLFGVGSEIIDYYYRIEIIDEISNTNYDYVYINIFAFIEIADYIINQIDNDINEKSILQWRTYTNEPGTNYQIEVDEQLVKSGTYSNNTWLYYDFRIGGLLETGNYNISILVWDVDNEIAVYTSIVDYIDNDPNIYITPNDISYSKYQTGNIIKWAVVDPFSNYYEIYRNGSLVINSTWSEGEYISYNIDGLTENFVYQFQIQVYDIGGHVSIDVVLVTVYPDKIDPLLIFQPSNFLVAEFSTGNVLEWLIFDDNSGTYIFYRNGTNINSGSWESLILLSIDIDGLGLGLYNFTLVIVDVYGNQITDQIWVRVVSDDGNPQIIISTNDYSYSIGSTGNIIVWGFVDNHPDYITISRNSTEILNVYWENGNLLIIDIDGLSTGVWIFDLIVYDTIGNSSTDQVIITVS